MAEILMVVNTNLGHWMRYVCLYQLDVMMTFQETILYLTCWKFGINIIEVCIYKDHAFTLTDTIYAKNPCQFVGNSMSFNCPLHFGSRVLIFYVTSEIWRELAIWTEVPKKLNYLNKLVFVLLVCMHELYCFIFEHNIKFIPTLSLQRLIMKIVHRKNN